MEIPQISEDANVVGVGIDQIEVSRIRESIKRHGNTFLNKVFTADESSFCMERADPAPCLAARFALKEAVSKALGTGIGKEFGWLDVEVKKEENGKPVAQFSAHGLKALHHIGGKSAFISLSHLQEVACAIAVLVKK